MYLKIHNSAYKFLNPLFQIFFYCFDYSLSMYILIFTTNLHIWRIWIRLIRVDLLSCSMYPSKRPNRPVKRWPSKWKEPQIFNFHMCAGLLTWLFAIEYACSYNLFAVFVWIWEAGVGTVGQVVAGQVPVEAHKLLHIQLVYMWDVYIEVLKLLFKDITLFKMKKNIQTN